MIPFLFVANLLSHSLVKSNCKPNEFECVGTGKCINEKLKCNGYVDCVVDFSDELLCSNGKMSFEFEKRKKKMYHHYN